MRYLAIVISALVALDAGAAQSTACKKLMWQPGQQYEIYSSLNQSTHIILPEKLATKPIAGNRELWNVDSAGSHVFIQPNTTEPAGASTTLTVITQSDVSYDFIVRRSTTVLDSCIQIVEGRLLDTTQRSALDSVSDSAPTGGVNRQKLEALQAQNKEEKESAVREAIRKYRYHIYTRYDWSAGGGFIGQDLISDIYDDGRFTYIRLANDNKGLLVIEAQLSEKPEFVEAKYDDVSKIYRVVGIYPKFTLKYEKTRVDVTRHDNRTQGNY